MNLWEKLHRRRKPEPLEPEEPRRAPRLRVPALTAYYWDGARPSPHGIRDISQSGMYIYTGERWYPGTLVLMRLQREDCSAGSPERSVAVLSRVMREGEDGVGLEFVFANPGDPEEKPPPLAGGAEKGEFDWFLAHLVRKYGEAALHQSSSVDRGKEAPSLHDVGCGEGGVGA